MMSEANKKAVGGTHYKRNTTEAQEEHWDRMWRLYGRGWFVGNITKYAERYQFKNGWQDLIKLGHYYDKLMELEKAAANGTGPLPGSCSIEALPPFPSENPKRK